MLRAKAGARHMMKSRAAHQAYTVMAVTAEPGRREALLAEAMADLIEMA